MLDALSWAGNVCHRRSIIGDRSKTYPKPDNELTFDKLSSVFLSGNATRDDAPNHIRIQEQVALMWQNMCPAAVYQVPDEVLERAEQNGGLVSMEGETVDVQVTPLRLSRPDFGGDRVSWIHRSLQ